MELFLLYSFPIPIHIHIQTISFEHTFLKIIGKKLQGFEFCETGAFDSLTEDI